MIRSVFTGRNVLFSLFLITAAFCFFSCAAPRVESATSQTSFTTITNTQPLATQPPQTSDFTTVEQTSAPETLPSPDMSAAYIYENNPGLTPVDYSSPALLSPSADMGREYIDSLVFICDSPTYWMTIYGLVNKTQIWSGTEWTLTLAYHRTSKILDHYDGSLVYINEAVEKHRPEYIVVALGINGVSFMDEDYFISEYTELVTGIREKSPETKIILQSIYPITRAYRYYGDITNAKITMANSWILNVAEETGCVYLDTISVLLDDSGNAKAELMQKDGLHPNKAGLELVLSYIRTHGYAARD